MKNQKVKYSIIIPVYNSIKYLPTCIESIIIQDFESYEIIVSDDNSSDGTDLYLKTLNHPKVRVVRPERRLSMAEHFEWALQHAKGDWLMFVGGDDGLQSYFFSLAEKLTELAIRKNIRTIMSDRAYFFWPGCESLYGNVALSYTGVDSVKTLSCGWQALLALLGFQTYFELPQMYTTSLFARSIVEEALQKQGGNLFSTVPADANLGAIACSLESRYLKSLVPLGWIGTSPGGVLITMESVSQDKVEPTDYIGYHPFSGDFALRSCSIYYWNALIRTSSLRKSFINNILLSKLFRTLMFAAVLAEIKISSKIDGKARMVFFNDAIRVNKCSESVVKALSKVFPILYKIAKVKDIIYLKVLKTFNPAHTKIIYWTKESAINLVDASKSVKNNLTAFKLIK